MGRGPKALIFSEGQTQCKVIGLGFIYFGMGLFLPYL